MNTVLLQPHTSAPLLKDRNGEDGYFSWKIWNFEISRHLTYLTDEKYSSFKLRLYEGLIVLFQNDSGIPNTITYSESEYTFIDAVN